jgi:hypothetical protein
MARGEQSMTKSLILVVGVAAASLSIGVGHCWAQEEAVTQDKIPRTVMDALRGRFPDARIDTCLRTREGRDVVYDIEFHQRSRKFEADIKENGAYINYEQAIEAGDLPKVVRDVLARRYPRTTPTEVMKETEVKGKTERLSAYEVVLMTDGGKSVEVRLSPNGKVLEVSAAKKP